MKKVTHCRACGSKALTPVINTRPNRSYIRGAPAFQYVMCDPSLNARGCGLLQADRYGVSPAPAPSGRHASNRDHLRALATEALELLSGRDCAALDIGCNDGSLLSYYPRWVDRYGVDPSDCIDEIGSWAWAAKAPFPSADVEAAFGGKKFDIITAASVLETIDDPRAFLSAVKARLTPDGIFALETLYAPKALTHNAVEVLHAGASAVYSLSVLEWLIRSEGMKVVKGALTAKEGGSIRLFVTHRENEEFDFDPWNERLARLWDEENALAMRSLTPYQSFEQRVAAVRRDFADIVSGAAARGETVHAIGADAQTLALLAFLGPVARQVGAVVDSHAARETDRFSPAGLPVISEAEARAAEPDYLIAPSRLRREMLERWREPILLGAKLIFATPAPLVVTAANYASEYAKTIAAIDNSGGTESLRSILAAAGGLRLVADNPDRASASASSG